MDETEEMRTGQRRQETEESVSMLASMMNQGSRLKLNVTLGPTEQDFRLTTQLQVCKYVGRSLAVITSHSRADSHSLGLLTSLFRYQRG